MLRALTIRGLAVIEKLDLEFHPGLSVFSGETGAGKSILVGAIGLVLGNRATQNLIRRDAERAEITLECDPTARPEACAWLEQHEFDFDDGLLLRRVISRSGSSRAYINDTPASAGTLREIGQQLIEIHGQQEHQRLLRRDQQRIILDAACGHGETLAALADCYQRWSETRTRLDALSGDAERHAQALSLLKFQVDELNALGLEDGTYEDLDARQHTLAGADELKVLCEELIDTLYEHDEHAEYARLAAAADRLEQAAQIDPKLEPAREFLPQAMNSVEEAVGLLRAALDRIDLDPESLAEVEQSLGAIHDLARKHQVAPRELWQQARDLNEKLEQWQSPEYDAEALAEEVSRLEQDYLGLAQKVHQARAKTAKRVSGQVTELLQQLGMPHSEFQIEVSHDPQRAFGPNGLDDIDYRLATGPDQSPGPISAIASGGELSRLSLAIQQSLTSGDEPPVMIFDEVDAGIGGGAAEIVGQLLAQLAERLQVLCVTHLPQVAVQAHHQYCVRKHDGVRTEVALLDREGRVEELARMLSGIEKTRTAREHAEALLQHSHGSA